MDVRGRAAECTRGEQWFSGLSIEDKWGVGDAFVLGEWDWRDWFERKPTPSFMQGAENARLLWECSAEEARDG